ncbi:MAG: urate hydroxylase PuuD [Chlamydiae bacterium]|nr:urate hydroxylase PuuD [Chlamydiota bacterium]MBI3266269.1 urate hydroxylase PuuD [Chlamydiota bacterium]
MSAEAHIHVLFLLRWIHFIAGITWIGHLYFFNFVNVPFAKTMDADTKKKVVPQLAPRALFWFRWGAMFTFLSGVLYIVWKIFIGSNGGLMGVGGLFTSTWGKWISFGGLLGTIMWFNVWFIIWPAQKKIISWIKAGQAPAEMAGLVKRAYLASRTNTYLSIPMLFGMGAAGHFPEFKIWYLPIVLAVGVAIAWHLIKVSNKAGADF